MAAVIVTTAFSSTPAPSPTSAAVVTIQECVAISNIVSGDATLVVMSPVPTAESTRTDVVCFQDLFPSGSIETESLQTFTISDAPVDPDAFNTASGSPAASPSVTAFSSEPTAESTLSSAKHSNLTGPIVGSIVGALALAVILGVVIIMQKRRRQRREEAKHQWVRTPNKWTFNGDRKGFNQPQELDKVVSPTRLTHNV